MRYFHTIRYLQWRQIFYRLWYRIPVKVSLKHILSKRPIKNAFIKPISKAASFVPPKSFRFLNAERTVFEAKSWNSQSTSKLWLYNLHYFDWLQAGEHYPQPIAIGMIQRWIKENPISEGAGWEPYPTSLRIVNWIKWLLVNPTLVERYDIENSLVLQSRLLSQRLEFHILGNHLLANAKALIFAGCYFHGDEANTWFKNGLALYQEQLKEQFLLDGGHFERSPMYHAILTEDFLDIFNLYHTYGLSLPTEWPGLATKMLNWLRLMTHSDGEVSYFNDSVKKGAVTYLEIINYAKSLNTNIFSETPGKNKLTHLKESGFAVVERPPYRLLCDIGCVGPSYQPGHAHAGTFSFEFSAGQQRVFINSGISTYEVGQQRSFERSTAAHSTIEFDAENSSDVWHGFRVAKRAKVTQASVLDQDKQSIVQATHNGYSKFNNAALVTRKWILNKKELIIQDSIDSRREHSARIFFFLAPNIKVRKLSSYHYLLINPQGEPIGTFTSSGANTTSITSQYSESMGYRVENQCICISVARVRSGQCLVNRLSY